MLEKLELIRYRGFESHSLNLRPLSVAVGHNNAGKSTIVEALRVLSLVTERRRGLNFRDPPPWANLPRRERGVSPSVDGLSIQFDTICYHYEDAPAEATGTFASGESIRLLINSQGQSFAVLKDASGQLITTKGRAQEVAFPSIRVLPQISPLDPSECILADDYVRRNMSSPLASRHFRNQLRLGKVAYPHFKQLAEDTWPGIQILQLEGARGYPGDNLQLLVRDRNFAAEVGLMGHGLQMWLQAIWFLSRVTRDGTIVLDEPDVYMHPDLQRKLIRIVQGMFRQVIIATHSVEIVADVDPSQILVVDRNQARSQFADTLPAVQRLIEGIGGVHNVHLARLWSARRLILVEGKDLGFLKVIHDKLCPDSDMPLDNIPNSSIGGWSGWPYAIGQSMFAQNALGQTVRVYCILDSDYQTPETILRRKKDAADNHVALHVWSFKEIENYFIIPDVITRVLLQRHRGFEENQVRSAVSAKIKEVVMSLKDSVFDSYSEQFRADDPRRGLGRANQRTRDLLAGVFNDPERALARVSGKEVISQLSSWLHNTYGRGVSVRDILREILPTEVPQEVIRVLTSIEQGKPFEDSDGIQEGLDAAVFVNTSVARNKN